jgi:hypothetical protein
VQHRCNTAKDSVVGHSSATVRWGGEVVMTHSVVDDVVVGMPVAPGGTRCGCAPARRSSRHHDQLLAVESDPDALLDLLELAVTWGELDYGDADVLPPEAWIDFAAEHRWCRPDRVARLFALATDVALRGTNPPASPELCAVTWQLSARDILRGEL